MLMLMKIMRWFVSMPVEGLNTGRMSAMWMLVLCSVSRFVVSGDPREFRLKIMFGGCSVVRCRSIAVVTCSGVVMMIRLRLIGLLLSVVCRGNLLVSGVGLVTLIVQFRVLRKCVN